MRKRSEWLIYVLVILGALACSKENDRDFLPKTEIVLPDKAPVRTFDKFPEQEGSRASPFKYGYHPDIKEKINRHIASYLETTGLIAVVGGEIIYSYGNLSELSAYGRFITLLPALDMVVAHKTATGDTPFYPYYQLLRIIADSQIIKNYLNR